MLLSKQFYLSEDVVSLARNFLGKYLFTKLNSNIITGGIISETEAYAGVNDKASHAFGNRRTRRTETMFCGGGVAYVYLCYGIHSLFNIVTNKKDIPHAVLVRGVIPTHGIEIIKERTGYKKISSNSLNGPGKVTKGLGINTTHDKNSLTGNQIWLEDRGLKVSGSDILVAERVGVDYAGEDALLPYRFVLKEDYCNNTTNGAKAP